MTTTAAATPNPMALFEWVEQQGINLTGDDQGDERGTRPSAAERRSLVQAFWRFHQANPHVYELLVTYAHEAKHAGRSHLGIALLFERVRWYTSVETTGGDFKVNNSYRSLYARLIMHREPALRGLFETRRLHREQFAPEGAAA